MAFRGVRVDMWLWLRRECICNEFVTLSYLSLPRLLVCCRASISASLFWITPDDRETSIPCSLFFICRAAYFSLNSASSAVVFLPPPAWFARRKESERNCLASSNHSLELKSNSTMHLLPSSHPFKDTLRIKEVRVWSRLHSPKYSRSLFHLPDPPCSSVSDRVQHQRMCVRESINHILEQNMPMIAHGVINSYATSKNQFP